MIRDEILMFHLSFDSLDVSLWIYTARTPPETAAPSWNRHLTVVVGFGCPKDPRSYVVGDCLPPAGSVKANWS